MFYQDTFFKKQYDDPLYKKLQSEHPISLDRFHAQLAYTYFEYLISIKFEASFFEGFGNTECKRLHMFKKCQKKKLWVIQMD